MTRPDSAARPLRILHVMRAPVGGLFRAVIDLTRGQIARGHDVGIVCDESTGGDNAATIFRDLEPHLSLGLHRIRIGRGPGLGDLRNTATMRRIARQTSPDILHGHGAKGGMLTRLPGFVDRDWVPNAYTPHGGAFHFQTGHPRDRLYRGVERLLARRTDLFLMESEYIAQQAANLLGEISSPLRVVHNGITEPEFSPITTAPDARDLVFVGEMRELKGVDTLIEALALLKAEGMPCTALLVGAGPDVDRFQAQVEASGLSGEVDFAAPQPIREALAKGRVFVMPSRGESLPYVVLEAAAAGVPMIATRVGGIPEIFGPFSSLLIPPSDSRTLTQAIRAKLSATDAERRTESDGLTLHVRDSFGYEAMVNSVLNGYALALDTPELGSSG